jgi:pyrroline-5-carboxylate reductase
MPTGCGVTMIHYAPTLETADRETLEGILSSVGALYEASAVDIPYYSALMSCGPALYATMFELFADTLADKRGFNRDLCRKMVRDCVEGTLLLQELDGADTDEVVKRVAHPGGPSEAGTLFLKEKLPGLYQEMLVKMKKW